MQRLCLKCAFTTLILGSSCCPGEVPFTGIITDRNGNPVGGVDVLVYPVQKRLPGSKGEPRLVGNGSDVLRTTAGDNGRFTLSVPSEGKYHVCTQGAPAPLLDHCSVDQFSAVSINNAPAGLPTRISLSQGIRITVSLNDPFGRFTPESIDVALGIDRARAAPVAARQIDSDFASFVFTVPAHSTGHVIVRSPIGAFVGGDGQEIAVGVPDLPWSADTTPAITLIAQ
jgi:hypothetical protein